MTAHARVQVPGPFSKQEGPAAQGPSKASPPVQRAGGPEAVAAADVDLAKGFVKQMPDMTLLQCCASANFWLLFLTCSIGGPAVIS